MNYFKSAAIGAVFAVAASMSHAATVDFSGFSSGDILRGTTDLGNGIIADINANGGAPNLAVIFDTNPPVTGGDVDLASPFVNSVTGEVRTDFNNALIVQENGARPIVPDDRAAGGILNFEFASLISFGTVSLLDARAGSFVTVLRDGTNVLRLNVTAANESDTANGVTPNQFTALDFGGVVGDRLRVSFSASGALGEFEASVVPLPAALPLALLGLGALGLVRRRKKA